MSDLFDYLDWRGDLSFEAVPFGKIDALLLSQISYLRLYNLVPYDFKESEAVRLCELAKSFKGASDYDFRTDLGPGINEKTPELLERASQTERFKNVKACALREKIDEENAEQFAAITYILGKSAVVVFRGTDSSLVGWKEDCNIACLEEIPSQRDALLYCEAVFSSLKTDFILCGHSKGGNLAINSAVKCGAKSQKKISAIYNFDGPGFSKAFYKTEGFLKIEARLTNVYPYGSIVGMIFYHPEKYEIIKSNGVGAGQHDPFTWQIKGNTFIQRAEFSKESKFFYTSLNNWIERMSTEEKQAFVNSVFEVIEASDYKSLNEIMNNLVPSSAKMIKKLSSMDKETREAIKNAIHNLHTCIKAEIPFLRVFER